MFILKIQLHGGVIRAVTNVLGFGDDDDGYDSGYAAGQAAQAAQTTQKVTVAPSVVTPTDVSGETGTNSTAKARRKKGFASTVSSSTLMGSSGDGRTTLG